MTRELRKSAMTVACAGFLAAGCAGLEITTLSHKQVNQSRESPDQALDGYVIYEPMVVVEVSLKKVCPKGYDKDNKCEGGEVIQCAAGKPFQLPNHSRPYLVRSKSGFGKSGVEVAITDGWQLGSIKDNSDNTALLGPIATLLGIKQAEAAAAKGEGCQGPGLYRVTVGDDGKPDLYQLKGY